MKSEFRYSLFQRRGDFTTTVLALAEINNLTRASRWKPPQFSEALKHDSFLTFLAKNESEIIGYAIFSVVPPEAHLVNLAVSPKYQNQGVGRSFFEFSLSTLKQRQICECWLEVRSSNVLARNFYNKANFKEVQIRKDFYQEPQEDALLMMAML